MTNPNKPAFPVPNWHEHTPAGMTLREYYAGQALAGLLTKIDIEYEQAAEYAVKHADALIAALQES